MDKGFVSGHDFSHADRAAGEENGFSRCGTGAKAHKIMGSSRHGRSRALIQDDFQYDQ